MPISPHLWAAGGMLAGGALDMIGAGQARDAYSDMQSTAINWAAQNRDLGLAYTAPYRTASYAAQAGLMDMLGLSRSSHPLYGDGQWAQEGPLGGTFAGVSTEGNPWYELPSGASPDVGIGEVISRGGHNPNDPRWAASNLYAVLPTGQTEALSTGVVDDWYDQNAPSMQAPYDWQASPSYDFRINEAMREVENSAAARGGLLSGGFPIDVSTRIQSEATQEYDRVINRLGSLAGLTTQAGDPRSLLNTASVAPQGAIGAAGAGMAGNTGAGAWSNVLNELGAYAGYQGLLEAISGGRSGGSYEYSYPDRNPGDVGPPAPGS